MGVHKNLFYNPDHISSEFICSVCTHVLLQPYQVLCSYDHIFCKACLSSFIQQSVQEHPSSNNSNLPPSSHQSKFGNIRNSGNIASRNDTDTLSNGGTFKSSMPHKDCAVECPGCKRMGNPPKLLPVSSFRPAKFVERIIQGQSMRCPTTMSRSCQWNGSMKDLKKHLSVCGFAVELLCPHHLFGCSFRGSASDIVNHLSRCPFSLHDISNTTIESRNTSFQAARNHAPLSPQSSPIQPPIAHGSHFGLSDMNHPQDTQQNHGHAIQKGVQTPLLSSSREHLEDSNVYQLIQSGDMVELDAEDVIFLSQLEELAMTDIPNSSTNTPMTTHNQADYHPPAKLNQPPLSPTIPTRRRRLIVDEESEQSITGVTEKFTPYNKSRSRLVSEEPGQKRAVSQTQNINTRTGIQSEIVKDRVLKDITMSVYASGKKSLQSPKSTTMGFHGGDIPMRDSTLESQGTTMDHQPNPSQSNQHEQNEQHGQHPFTQNVFHATPIGVTNAPEQLGEEQQEAPWTWQGNNTEIRSQESIGDLTNITSPIPSTGIQDARASSQQPLQNTGHYPGSVVMGQQTNFTTLFTMSQPSQFFVAEPSSYLPLLVHVPRYLRSRRKNQQRGHSSKKKMTPIVHNTQHSNNQEKNETSTQDITSPENSYLSHKTTGRGDGQQQQQEESPLCVS